MSDSPIPEAQPTTVIDADVSTPRPHVRWSTLVWGVIVIAAAAGTLSIVGSPAARDGFGGWVTGLGVGGWIVVGVVALGALILLQGVLALLKLTQRPRA